MTPGTHRQRFEGEREQRQLAPGRRSRPRIAATAAAVAAAAAALTGCQLAGTVDVGLSDVAVDLTLTHRVSTTSNPCTDIDTPLLRKEVAITPDGSLSCRFTGALPHDQVPNVGGTFVASAESIVLTASGTPHDGVLPADASLDLTFTFPGDVVVATAGGTVSGNRVHFDDIAAAQAEGIGIVARPATAPDSTVWWWGLSGLVAGTSAGAGATWVWRRRRRPGASAEMSPLGALEPVAAGTTSPQAEPAASAGPSPGAPADDPSVWASDDPGPGERTP